MSFLRFVTVESLADKMAKGGLKIIDSSLGPCEGMFTKIAIPGAQYLDLSSFKEESYKPNLWPTAATVAARA